MRMNLLSLAFEQHAVPIWGFWRLQIFIYLKVQVIFGPLTYWIKPLVYATTILNSLSLMPLEWQFDDTTYQPYILFPMLAADYVARCVLQGVKQFNGKSSCTYCVATGKQFGVKQNNIFCQENGYYSIYFIFRRPFTKKANGSILGNTQLAI